MGIRDGALLKVGGVPKGGRVLNLVLDLVLDLVLELVLEGLGRQRERAEQLD